MQRTATLLHAATACSCARCPPVSRLHEATRAPVLALRPVLPSPTALALRDLVTRAAAALVTAPQPLPSRPRLDPLPAGAAGAQGADTEGAAGDGGRVSSFETVARVPFCGSPGSAGHACPFRRQTVTAKQRVYEHTPKLRRQVEMHTDSPPAAAVQQRGRQLSWMSGLRGNTITGSMLSAASSLFEICGLLSPVDLAEQPAAVGMLALPQQRHDHGVVCLLPPHPMHRPGVCYRSVHEALFGQHRQRADTAYALLGHQDDFNQAYSHRHSGRSRQPVSRRHSRHAGRSLRHCSVEV